MIRRNGYDPDEVRPIPRFVYHASPHAAEISAEGMRLVRKREQQTFGGHAGAYISATTRENADFYAEALRDMIGAARGDWGYDQLDAFTDKWHGDIKKIEGWIRTTIPQWLGDISRHAPHKLKENLPLMWLLGHVWHMSDFPLFIDLESSWPKFKKMKPEQVGVIEIEIDPRIVYRRWINNADMTGAYSYNAGEEEWRVHDLSMIKSVRRLP